MLQKRNDNERSDAEALNQEIRSKEKRARDLELRTSAMSSWVRQTFTDITVFSHAQLYIMHTVRLLEEYFSAAGQMQSSDAQSWTFRMLIGVQNLFISDVRGEGLEGLISSAYLVHEVALAFPLQSPGWFQLHRAVGKMMTADGLAMLQADAANTVQALQMENGFHAFLAYQAQTLSVREDSEDGVQPARPMLVRPISPAKGPCNQCQHFRSGGSTACASFEAILAPFRPRLQQQASQTVQEEQRNAGLFEQELESFESNEQMQYQLKPTQPSFHYCGVDELEGNYFAFEIKNRDNSCTQFTPQRPELASHSCATCSYNRQPSTTFVEALQRTGATDDKAKAVIEEILVSVQGQAESEYQECVAGGGILYAEPRVLPVCQAYALEDESGKRYVVGPVINAAERCELWCPGPNRDMARKIARLNELESRAKSAVAESKSLPISNARSAAGQLKHIDKYKNAAANAQADLIEYCLDTLGTDPSIVTAMGGKFTAAVWYTTRDAASQSAAPATAATATADAPKLFGTMLQNLTEMRMEQLKAFARTFQDSDPTQSDSPNGAGVPQAQGISAPVPTNPSAVFAVGWLTYYQHPSTSGLVLYYEGWEPFNLRFTLEDRFLTNIEVAQFQPQGQWTQLPNLPIMLNVHGLTVLAMWI